MFLITSLLTLVFAFWMCARIWSASPFLAVGSFFFLPLAIIPLIQNWGDEESDIKLPFLLTVASSVYTTYSMMSYMKPDEIQESLLRVIQLFA